jgi:hypothetical protein
MYWLPVHLSFTLCSPPCTYVDVYRSQICQQDHNLHRSPEAPQFASSSSSVGARISLSLSLSLFKLQLLSLRASAPPQFAAALQFTSAPHVFFILPTFKRAAARSSSAGSVREQILMFDCFFFFLHKKLVDKQLLSSRAAPQFASNKILPCKLW